MKILMYDLAREQSWVSEPWRRILPDLREVGYTDVALYVEQRYHFRSMPQHRPLGGITPAQAAEARRLCHKFGLRLHWFTNTLGHCDGLLANEQFLYLAEDVCEMQQICPSHPHTRPLLRRMLAEFAAINPSPILHIGGDEAWALNSCPRCRQRRLTAGELYLDHFRWVIRETKRLGQRPAMWGDMLLQYPSILSQIDRDVLVFDWHYESGSADTIRLFQQHGFEVVPTTSTNEWSTLLFPFRSIERGITPLMNDARRLGCRSICQSSWELIKGAALFECQWERLAAAPAVFEGRPLGHFAQRFFGSARADQNRLQPLLDERKLRHIHPILAGWDHGRGMRLAFLGTDSAYAFYYTHREADTRAALRKVLRRIREARPIVRDMQRSATRRKHYLEHLDLPLEVFEAMYDRLETLAAVRAAADRLHPHRRPNAEGTRILRNTVRQLARHIRRCETLVGRFEEIRKTRGGSHHDVLRLRRQIGQLRTLRGYVTYHARTYKDGVPVPPHELWCV